MPYVGRVASSRFAHGPSEARARPDLVAQAEREKQRLGARLLALRTKRNLTQAQVAEQAGIHPVHVSRIESGDANVTITTLVALAVTYGVPLRDFFE